MIGKFFCTADFTMAYVFSSELNPTVVRTSGMGISLGSSRIGSIIATQVHLLVSISYCFFVAIYKVFVIKAFMALFQASPVKFGVRLTG